MPSFPRLTALAAIVTLLPVGPTSAATIDDAPLIPGHTALLLHPTPVYFLPPPPLRISAGCIEGWIRVPERQ